MNITTGQHLRVTALQTHIVTEYDAVAQTEGSTIRTKEISLGAVYEGIVTGAATDGFFDLKIADGSVLGFYARDGTIKIDVLDTPDRGH